MATPATFGPLVDAAWLADNRDSVVIADVRSYLDGRSGREAHAAGHIPGAVFVDLDVDLSAPAATPGGRHPLPTPESFAASMGRLGIGDDSRVVAYDDAGGTIAARLWWMFDALGLPAAVLDGGIATWDSTALSTEPVDPVPASFTARPWPTDRLASADEVLDRLDDHSLVLLDARSAERYAGIENPIDPRFGHIPGAHSAPATANIDTTTGMYESVAAAAERYARMNATAGADIVAYCGSGVTACADLLGLRRLGIDARLYVGSWSDWGADDTKPISSAQEAGPA